MYSLQTAQWRQISSINEKRVHPAVHLLNGQLMVLGGHTSDTGPGNKIEIFNNKTWEISNDLLGKKFLNGVSIKIKCPN